MLHVARLRAAFSNHQELTRLLDFGKTENYGRRGSCSSRARRCRSRFVREGETKSQYVTAIESRSAATPSSNCQPVPTRTFIGNSGISNAGGAFLRPEKRDATRSAHARQAPRRSMRAW